MKKIMFILLCGVIPFLLSSCSDDDDNGGGSSEVVKQITKLDFSSVDDVIFTFSYDAQNRLSSFVVADELDDAGKAGVTTTEKLEYNNEGKLVKLITVESDNENANEYTEFSYNNNTIIAKYHYKSSEQSTEFTNTYTLTLNDKGLITKRASESYYELYTYDANNNLIKGDFFTIDGKPDGTSQYVYDDLKSAFANQNIPAWFWVYYDDFYIRFAGKNNAIKCTYTYEGKADVEEYSFKADEDGYPISVTANGKTINAFTYRTVK